MIDQLGIRVKRDVTSDNITYVKIRLNFVSLADFSAPIQPIL